MLATLSSGPADHHNQANVPYMRPRVVGSPLSFTSYIPIRSIQDSGELLDPGQDVCGNGGAPLLLVVTSSRHHHRRGTDMACPRHGLVSHTRREFVRFGCTGDS
jgi:hypothetical protein